jgi:hypothetical protein
MEGVGLLMNELFAGDKKARTGGFVSTTKDNVAGWEIFPARSATVALN